LVVFEAGMSAPAASWVHTQREISAHTRTLSYDRAGYGGSDDDPHDRTLERLTDDLTALLEALGETAPAVLVGHSWGGPIIRLFAARHPERIAGLVFVDATVVECMPPRNARIATAGFHVMAQLARVGAGNIILHTALPHGPSPDISVHDIALMRRDYACARAMRTGAREAKHIIPALPVLRRLQDEGTPDVPTVYLQGARIDRGMTTTRPLFNRTAAQLTATAPRGTLIEVEGAGHLIPQERPAAVRDAILGIARHHDRAEAPLPAACPSPPAATDGMPT
jgi:pimeloyl-ACP methyl ester carboxylesterase